MNPEPTKEFISWLFKGMCVGLSDHMCFHSGTDRSHIEPKSRGNSAKGWKNYVLHCRICHAEWHTMGASEENIKKLHDVRKEFLMMIGREDYV